MGGTGADDHELCGEPAPGTDHGHLRPGCGVPVRRARHHLPPADLAGLGGAGLRLGGGRLQVGVGGHLETDGVPGRLVPVRHDDLLLPHPARVRGQHAGVRHQP